jgi:hypothetical protein
VAGKYKKFKTPIYCPNASDLGYCRYKVVIGDFISWRYPSENGPEFGPYYGRVLGEATHNGLGQPYPKKSRVLAVLMLGEQLNHGYVEHVNIEYVRFIRTPGAFLKWALFGDMLDIETTDRLAQYGALSDGHIDKLLDESGTKIVRMPWDKTTRG